MRTNSKNRFNKFNKYIMKINTIIIYVCIISMFLFLSTDFFRYIKYLVVIVSLYVLFYSYLVKWKNIKNIFNKSFPLWFIFLWTLILIMTVLRNPSQFVTIFKTFCVFSMYIFNIILLYVDDNTKKQFDTKTMIRVVSTIICMWIIVSDFKLLVSGERIGFSIMTLNPNGAGTVLSILFFALIYFVKSEKKYVDIILSILVLFVIFLTGSKHAIIMACVSLFVFIFKDGKLSKKRLLVLFTGIILSIALIFTIPFLKRNVGDRFLKLLGTMNVIDYENDYSSTQRVKYTSRAIELWEKTPIFGGGYNNVKINSGYNTYSHNNYIEILCTVGIIGFVVYYGYIVYLLYRLLRYRIRRKSIYDMRNISVLVLVSILISDIGAVTFTLYPFYYIVYFLIDYKFGISFNENNKLLNNK